MFLRKVLTLQVHTQTQFSSGTAAECSGTFRRSLEDAVTLALFGVRVFRPPWVVRTRVSRKPSAFRACRSSHVAVMAFSFQSQSRHERTQALRVPGFFFFFSNGINYHSSCYPGLRLVSRHGLGGGVRLIPVKAYPPVSIRDVDLIRMHTDTSNKVSIICYTQHSIIIFYLYNNILE